MKEFKSIEDQLKKKSGAAMRPEFRQNLRRSLLQQATAVQAKNSFLFSNIWINMKKFSYLYFSLALILAIGLWTFTPGTLSAAEVLAKTLESYEKSSEIYHEKSTVYSYEKGEVVTSRKSEVFYDFSGNNLQIDRGADDKLHSIFLQTKYADTYYFYDPSTGTYLSPNDKNDQAYLDKLEGEKIFCVNKFENDSEDIALIMAIAADDYSVYSIDRQIAEKVPSKESQDIMKLTSASKELPTKEFIEDLISQNNYAHSRIKENGIEYDLFKITPDPKDYFGYQEWIYISSETYKMAKREDYSSSGEIITRTVIETSEYLNSDSNPDLFNPAKYPELKQINLQSYEDDFSKNLSQNGCYDQDLNPLTDEEFLQKLPQSVLVDWNYQIQQMKQEFAGTLTNLEELEIDFSSWQLPTNTEITQLFHSGHSAWDFSAEKAQDKNVYSPFEGTVILASDNHDWNGGYGKKIILSHQLDENTTIETLYAHLDNIAVSEGQVIKKGEILGQMGSTGYIAGSGGDDQVINVLHFEITLDGQKIDPASIWPDKR